MFFVLIYRVYAKKIEVAKNISMHEAGSSIHK